MIRPSKDGKLLLFIPPEKTQEQELTFPLISANVCPKCNNLVQALFTTDKLIDPKPWEEIFTKVLDGQGQYKRLIPGRSDRHRSRYKSVPIGRGPSNLSAQLIRFEEHFERSSDPNNVAICGFLAINSVIPEYRVYDMLLTQGLNPAQYKIWDEHWDHIKEKLIHAYSGGDQYVFAPAIGEGPECVFMSRACYNWYINDALAKYIKPYVPPVIK